MLRRIWRKMVSAFRVAFVLGAAGLAPGAPPPEPPPPPPIKAGEESDDADPED